MITNEILIYLFQKKDPSRKRILYKMYKELIDSDMSRESIIEIISREIGKTGLVSVSDIKYCRSEFKRKTQNSSSSPIESTAHIKKPTIPKTEKKKILDFDIQLTDPDEISTNKNILKSKHSYR